MYWRVYVYVLESICIKCIFELLYLYIWIICYKMNKFVDGGLELFFCVCSDYIDGVEV